MNSLLQLKNIEIFHAEICASTNDEIKNYFNENQTVALYTFNQTSGKGQYGNKWEINANENLAFSLAFPINNIELNEVALRYLIATIVHKFISKFIKNETISIKFPNDIYIKNKKVAGILIEKVKNFYIIGIGINVLQKEFINIPNASSIQNFTDEIINLKECTENFIVFLKEQKTLNETEILKYLNDHLYLKNKIQVIDFQSKKQNSKILKVNALGEIVIEFENNEIKKLKHKEFEFLR